MWLSWVLKQLHSGCWLGSPRGGPASPLTGPWQELVPRGLLDCGSCVPWLLSGSAEYGSCPPAERARESKSPRKVPAGLRTPTFLTYLERDSTCLLLYSLYQLRVTRSRPRSGGAGGSHGREWEDQEGILGSSQGCCPASQLSAGSRVPVSLVSQAWAPFARDGRQT